MVKDFAGPVATRRRGPPGRARRRPPAPRPRGVHGAGPNGSRSVALDDYGVRGALLSRHPAPAGRVVVSRPPLGCPLTRERRAVALGDQHGDREPDVAPGHRENTRSACAVMVSDGLTPRLALTADPSTTYGPGCPCTCCRTSRTESWGVAPIAQPPRKCAIIGTSTLGHGAARPGAGPVVYSTRRAGPGPRCAPPGSGRARLALPRGRRQPAGQQPTPAPRGDERAVPGLHDQADDRAPAPRSARTRCGTGHRVPERLRDEADRPRPAPPRPRAACRAGPSRPSRGVADILDVGFRRRVEEEVMASPRVRSAPAGAVSVVTPTRASEFVRVSRPRAGGRSGRTPSARIRCSSDWVPHAPAASTTSRHVTERTTRRRPGTPGCRCAAW